ncbi:hypothetical protein ACF061_12210 [Streptomyces sp. NPDC015220]|uniref:hypothetical protein n=1 Tax=Streptomyces sp. NPDC015220 TaxID=3364947 RepID=UPI0036F6551E
MGERSRRGSLSGAEAEAMAHYREARRKGRPPRELRTVNGARIRSKAERGWKGARFRWVIVGAGTLCCLAGVAVLVVAAAWAPAPRVVLSGVYFVGLGVAVVTGHPVSVFLARRRWAARATVVEQREAGDGEVPDGPRSGA